MRIIYYIGLELVILLYLFFWLGFAFHTSPHAVVFGKYSVKYFLALLVGIFLFYPFVKLYIYLTHETQFLIKKRKVNLTSWKKIGLVLIVLLLLLGISETFLRVKGWYVHSEPYILTMDNYHPFLQGHLTAENNKQNSELHIDSYGFRGDEININKSSKTYRIVVLGGSTVLNVAIAYNQTFGKLLEDDLQKRYPDKKIEVLNAGMDGYTSEHSLIQYLFYIKDFHPDLVIMWQGWNDMAYACPGNPTTNGVYKSDYSQIKGSLTNVLQTYYSQQVVPVSINIHFVTFDFIQHAFTYNFYSDFSPFYNTVLIPYLVHHGIIRLHPIAIKFPSLPSYRRNLISLIHATKDDNVALIIGNQPYLYNTTIDKQFVLPHWLIQKECAQSNTYATTQSLITGMNLFNNTTREVATNNNVPFIDLASAMPKTDHYFTDDIHYTNAGNKKIAEYLYDYIVKGKFISN